MRKTIYKICSLILIAAAASGLASCIDEDMSNCPPLMQDMEILYRVGFEQPSDPAFDTELSALHTGFWRTADTLAHEDVRLKAELPADLTFRFTLPRHEYTHLATANCWHNASAEQHFDSRFANVVIACPEISPDTIAAMQRPMYAGLLAIPKDTCRCDYRSYQVTLYPISSKMEITLTSTEGVTNIRAVVAGTKAAYRPADDSFIANPALRTAVPTSMVKPLDTDSVLLAYYTFPTQVGTSDSSADPSLAPTSSPARWTLTFFGEYGGKTIMNRRTVEYDLYPGQVYRNSFHFYADDTDVETGVEVDLDWKPGGDHDIEI